MKRIGVNKQINKNKKRAEVKSAPARSDSLGFSTYKYVYVWNTACTPEREVHAARVSRAAAGDRGACGCCIFVSFRFSVSSINRICVYKLVLMQVGSSAI